MHGLATGTHQDDHPLGIRRAMIFVERITTPGQFGKAIHHPLHDPGAGGVKRIHRFARLEKNIGILRRAANHRVVRRERAGAMFEDARLVDHRLHDFVRHDLDR